MPFLQLAKKVHSEHFPVLGAQAIGCTEEEIETLEKRVGLKLPSAYHEFLRWMGKGDGRFWIGLGGFYEGLPRYNEWARELVRESGSAAELPSDAFVVFWDDNYFYFLRTSEGDNPPVYAFLSPSLEELIRRAYTPTTLPPSQRFARYVFENATHDGFVLRSNRYSDFLADELLDHVRIVTKREAESSSSASEADG
jgi:hypothetical protein